MLVWCKVQMCQVESNSCSLFHFISFLQVPPVRTVPQATTVPSVDLMEATVFHASAMATLTFVTGRQAGVWWVLLCTVIRKNM